MEDFNKLREQQKTFMVQDLEKLSYDDKLNYLYYLRDDIKSLIKLTKRKGKK